MFSNPLLAPLFLSFLAAFVATLGLLVVAMRSDWSARYAHLFAVMASGILLTMASHNRIHVQLILVTRIGGLWVGHSHVWELGLEDLQGWSGV